MPSIWNGRLLAPRINTGITLAPVIACQTRRGGPPLRIRIAPTRKSKCRHLTAGKMRSMPPAFTCAMACFNRAPVGDAALRRSKGSMKKQ